MWAWSSFCTLGKHSKLVNAWLALCLASDGVLSLPIRVIMVALHSNSFCQTKAGTQETYF